jgi:WD40 repeat protein
MQPVFGTFSLTGPDGNVLWSKTAFGENACFIANDGRTVVGMRGPGVEGLPASLSFYGPKGEKKAAVTVKGLSGTAFSRDGSTFLVRSQDLGIGAFDCSGKKLWQVPGGRLFSPGPNGRRLAVEDQGTLLLYEQGKLVGKAVLGEPFAVALSFSPEGDYLAAATAHELRVYRAKDLGSVWTTEIKEPGKSFTSVSLSRGGEALAAGVGFDAGPNASPEKRYPKGEVLLYDAGGKPLWTREIALGGFAPHRPLVSLTEDGRTIRAVGADQTYIYEQR